jgi:hypothetical protein
MAEDLAVLGGVMLDRPHAGMQPATEVVTDRLGSSLVRRMTCRHPCPGAGCRNRNHRRDAYYFELMCEALGVSGEPAGPADYRAGPFQMAVLEPGEAASWAR